MNYSFDQIIDRTHTHCYKTDAKSYYNIPQDAIPLWVADMDFAAAPCITEALQSRVTHPIYGYTFTPDAYYDAVIQWMQSRHNWTIKRDWIVPAPNIVSSINLILDTFLNKDDKVLIQKPVYNPFEAAILGSGLTPVNNALLENKGYYTIDFEDFEMQAKDPAVKAFILCNPHNPVGRVWTKEELTKLGELCIKHGVLIIADEIHHDLIYKGSSHTSMGTLSDEISDRLIVCTSPSKTFNLSGIGCANIIIKNTTLREGFTAALHRLSLHNLSPLAIVSLIAAYTKGADWVNALTSYLEDNKNYITNFIQTQLPMLKVAVCESTYLLWVDMRGLSLSQDELMDFLTYKAKIWVNSGTTYDAHAEGFIRINFATPRSNLERALLSLKEALLKQGLYA